MGIVQLRVRSWCQSRFFNLFSHAPVKSQRKPTAGTIREVLCEATADRHCVQENVVLHGMWMTTVWTSRATAIHEGLCRISSDTICQGRVHIIMLCRIIGPPIDLQAGLRTL